MNVHAGSQNVPVEFIVKKKKKHSLSKCLICFTSVYDRGH